MSSKQTDPNPTPAPPTQDPSLQNTNDLAEHLASLPTPPNPFAQLDAMSAFSSVAGTVNWHSKSIVKIPQLMGFLEQKRQDDNAQLKRENAEMKEMQLDLKGRLEAQEERIKDVEDSWGLFEGVVERLRRCEGPGVEEKGF